LRFRRTRRHAAVRERLVAEARLRHEAELKGASFWGRLRAMRAVEAEVRAAIDRMYPPDTLYAAGGRR
jgi:hypothetical protein